ncbi:MAG: hypothetical protein IJC07_03175 [Clostridia bacterium]|nr:hypothetical protein [Clostridia bacterium]
MRIKRTAIVSFLICAIMAIGIGFAAISKNVEITGTANLGLDASNFKVELVQDGCSANDKVGTEATGVITVSTADASQATFVVSGLKNAGDKVTGTFTVKNASTQAYDAVLAAPRIQMGSETENHYVAHISVTTTGPQETTLAQGESTTFTVTVELTSVINDNSAQVSFMVLMSATSAVD